MAVESLFLVAALVVVPITFGSYKQLFTTRFVHWWTLALVLIGNLAITFAPIPASRYDSIGLAILMGTYAMLFGFCAANINLRGMWIVLVGLASNALVIGLNRGMPVTTSGGYGVRESIKHQSATSKDLLPWLSDIIPINQLSIAISPGDIIFGLGLIVVCIAASRKPKKVAEPVEVDEAVLINTDFEPEIVEGIVMLDPVDDNPFGYIDLRNDEISLEKGEEVENEIVLEAESVPESTEDAETAVVSEEPQESDRPMKRSSRRPGSRSSDEKHIAQAEHVVKKRRHKKWQKTHGLAALPTKEELGYDEESMEIVDIAQ